MYGVPNQVLIIALCLFQSLVRLLNKPQPPKVVQQRPVEDQAQKLTANPELQQLLARKKQIEATIEEFNNPSSFAKYSKMQRELIKINAKIKSIRESQDQQPQQAAPQPQLRSEQTQPQPLLPSWFNTLFSVVIISLSLTMDTSALIRSEQAPLSWVTNEWGQVNCFLVYLACKMLLF